MIRLAVACSCAYPVCCACRRPRRPGVGVSTFNLGTDQHFHLCGDCGLSIVKDTVVPVAGYLAYQRGWTDEALVEESA